MTPSAQVNLISGVNGSGKTSILEAIHLLSLGRSFRSHKHKTYIQYEHPECVIYAQLRARENTQISLGFRRQRDGSLEARIQGKSVQSAVEMAECLPVQLINPDAFRLLEGAPKIRRQFVDWGTFHSDAGFIHAWKGWQKALKQRNSLLRRGKISATVLAAFDQELIRLGSQVNDFRRQYVHRLTPVFQSVLSELSDLVQVDLAFQQGWDAHKTLEEAMTLGRPRDIEAGYSHIGPQRADLRVKTASGDALDTLSRGQQKLVVSALKIAQGKLLVEKGRPLIYLIDDLPAELDADHRLRLCRLLEQLDSQIFITCVEPDVMDHVWSDTTDIRRFQMQDGVMSLYPSEGLQES